MIERRATAKISRWVSMSLLVSSAAVSILWGLIIGLKSEDGFLDFQAVYYGTRCLVEHHNPYSVGQLEASYRVNGGERPTDSPKHRQLITLFVNLPTIFLFVAPLAMLSVQVAETVWLFLLIGVFSLGAFATWDLSKEYAPRISLLMIMVLLLGSEITFATANTAGIVIGLCIIAVWCFLRDRFPFWGIVCLAIALAIKPHDAGFVWLFFILSGGIYRKRALQALSITAILGVTAMMWVGHVAPSWMHDWSANLAVISGPNGLNNPGPQSITGNTAGMVVSLQAFLAVFRDDPHFYNTVSYLVCGVLLALWAISVLRSVHSHQNSLVALGAVVPLTMLITYHRAYDAKLLLLSIPACALLWAQGRSGRWLAPVITATAILMTGDVSLAIAVNLTNMNGAHTGRFLDQTLNAISTRPASLALLLMAIFYVWTYVRCPADTMRGVSKT